MKLINSIKNNKKFILSSLLIFLIFSALGIYLFIFNDYRLMLGSTTFLGKPLKTENNISALDFNSNSQLKKIYSDYKDITIGKDKTIIKSITCSEPYSIKNCSEIENQIVLKVQILLKINKYYDGSLNGIYSNLFEESIKKYQNDNNFNSDGILSSDLLTNILNKYNINNYKIFYNLNDGSGIISGTTENTQIMINEVKSPISSSKLVKNNSNHVGYTVSTTVDGEEYIAACLEKKCLSAKWYKKSDLIEKKYYEYVYSLGQNVYKIGFSNSQTIEFKAKYCKKNMIYDKETSSCIYKKTTGMNINDFKLINYDIKKISSQIGTQYKNQCCASALSYGIFILTNGKCKGYKASAESWAPYSYGQYTYKLDTSFKNSTSMFDKIKKEIDAGRPLVIHVKFSLRNKTVEHWLTVVGYRENVSSSKMNLYDLWIIDPFYKNKLSSKNHEITNVILYNGTISSAPFSKKATYYNYEIGYWIKK